MTWLIPFALGFLTCLFVYCLLDDSQSYIAFLEDTIRRQESELGELAAERVKLRHRLAVCFLRERVGRKYGVGELAAFWPDLEDVEDGQDIFRDKYGEPTGSGAKEKPAG